MKQKKTIKPFTVFLVFLCLAAASGGSARAVPVFVSHVAFVFEDGSVVFYRGSESGIEPGDIFEVVRNGSQIAALKAVEVDYFYTRAVALKTEVPLKEQDFIREAPAEARAAESGTAIPRAISASEILSEKAAPVSFASGGISLKPLEPAVFGSVSEGMILENEALNEKIKNQKLKVKLSGYRYLKYRTYNASGAYQNFLSRHGLLTYGSAYEQGTQLTAEIGYGESVKLKGNFYELPYQERDMKFELEAGKFKSKLGDFSSEFRSGDLAGVDKSVTGMQVQYTTEKIEADYLVSQSKSNPKTISFFGDNTHGPFTLKAFQVLENSEKVRINGNPVSKEKYDMDYYLGQITFCAKGDSTDCMEVKTSDQVQIDFEEKMLLSIKGGNITALSTKYKVTDSSDIGVAYIIQQANRASRRVREAGSYSTTGAEILAHTGCLPGTADNYICVPRISFSDRFAMIVKSSQKIYKNNNRTPLEKGVDYSVDDVGYAFGEFKILKPFLAGDTFKVEYTYYVKDFVKTVEKNSGDGKLRSQNGTERYITLAQSTIYSGTEVVYFCRGNVEDDCDYTQSLVRDTDYKIDEKNNAIDFSLNPGKAPSDLLNQFIQITYLYIPVASEESQYDHIVSEIYGNAALGPVNVKFDFGQSESDISKTPVQVLKEKLVIVNRAYVCPNTVPAPAGCSFILNRPNVVELSEKLSTSASGLPLMRGTQYELDYETGEITIRGDFKFATGVALFADYQYNPIVPEGIVSGNASRIGLATNIKKFQIGLETDNADTFFAPLSGNSTLETDRTSLSFSGPIGDMISFTHKQSSSSRAKDIYKTVTTDATSQDSSISFVAPKGHSLKYDFGSNEDVDSLAIHDTDQTRKFHAIAFGLKDVFTKGLNFDVGLNNEDFSDNTGNSDNNSSSIRSLDTGYKWKNLIDLKAKITDMQVDSSGVSGVFTSKNATKNFVISYYPTELITVEADIDHQTQTDSRPDSGAAGKDRTSVQINSKPFGKVKSINLNLIKQSYPSFNAGSNNTKTTYLSVAYGLTSAITMTPSINLTSTNSPQSYTDSKRTSVTADYRPNEKKYSTTLTNEWGDTTSGGPMSPVSSNSLTRLYWDVLYKMNEKTNFVFRMDKDGSSYSTGGSSSTITKSLDLSHQPGEKKKFTLKYIATDRSDMSSSSLDKSFLLESNIDLSKILKWNTQIRNSKYSTGKADQDYKGMLLETELRAQF